MIGLLFSLCGAAQPFLVSDGGTDNTCVGAFLDSGGQGAVGYTNNEDYTYTLCPDVAGNLISLTFVTFELSTLGGAPIDNLTIYDGPNTGSPSLGSFTGTALQGTTISASAGNASGCLTFVWHSNNTGTGVFAASIHCYQPCVPPVASAVMSLAAPARICVGDQVTFNGSGSTAQPGNTIASWTWDFDDGSPSVTTGTATTSHVFTTPGVHSVQLTVTDNNGCQSLNRIDLQVWVGTIPTFTGTGGTTAGCAGETLCLDGTVNAVEYEDDPATTYGNGIFIPDDVGSCFEAHVYLTQFAPGATLTNINQLLGICLNIEHSWLGDLVMTITSPSGESVILHQQGILNETLLGQPVDNDEANPQPGTCAQYCFTNASANGTMAAFANANNGSLGWELPPGTYQSLYPLTGLIGSQLNGLWTLTICDMWAQDNGFLCDWNIDLDPSLYTNIVDYTPQYGAACDSTWWTGPGITSTGPGCEHICLQQAVSGTYNYVYHAIDNFGCTFDTTLTITIAAPIVVNAGADVQYCAGGSANLNGTVISGGLPPPSCTYELDLFDSYGDGWDGAVIGVVINGVEQDWTLNDGTAGYVSIPVTTGNTIQLIYYPSGAFNGEHSYTLYDGNGAVVFNDTPPFVNGTTWNGVANCGPAPAFVYSWSPSTGLSNPNIANPSANPGSTTVYTLTVSQAGHPNCNGSDQVTVTVVNPVNAGTDAVTTVCANAAAFGLFPLLTGSPNAGGTWTAPGGGASNGTFTPGTSVPGVYTYSVNGVAPCPGVDQSTVTVNVVNPPSAGADAMISICTTNAATNLSTLLVGAQLGGTWTGPSGGAFSGWYDPNVDATGTYTYTVTGTAPCPNDQAVVNVTEVTAPFAGNDASVTVCANGANVDLFAQLGGGPMAGGTWTGPGGTPHNSTFVPGTDAAGVYTYALPGNPPCLPDAATVTVNVVQPPNAGTDGVLSVCTNGAATSLFAQLGGGAQPGGGWASPGGGFSTGAFTPGVDAPGTYIYTAAGTAPCANDQASVTVSTVVPPNAGTNGAITVCANGAAVNLFSSLGGGAQVGGTWTAPGGGASTGTFTPGTDAAGAYTYTVAGTPPCAADQATVTVTVIQPPNAGTDGVTTVCSNGAAFDLFGQLGSAPPGGTWTYNAAAHSNTFNPASDAAGVYTYTVAGTAPCANDQATVTVTVIQPPNAGTDGATTVCANGTAFNLFASLGGGAQAGGTWTAPGGGASSGTFTPGTDAAGVYTYTVAGTAPCANDQATVTVTVMQPPNAGTDGATTVCANAAAFNLFNSLGGGAQAGGTWTAPGGGTSTGTFTPGTDAAGVYTYTVAGTAPCANDQATVTVTVIQPPNAGTDGATTVCANGASFNLFASLGGGAQAGGTWTAPGGGANTGTFTPGADAAGVYTYTVTGTVPCANDQATVTVTVIQPPNAGTDGATTVCANGAAFNLFASLGGGAQAGGTWTAPGGGPSAGTFTPGTDAAGVYTYTVAGTAPCANDQATVTVTVIQPPNAGTDGATTVCANGAAFNLFASLGGGAQAGGTWTAPGGGASSGIFTPGTDGAGVYTYTVAGTAPCANDQATVTVTVIQPPNAGTDGATTVCANGAAFNLVGSLGGGAQAGGTWAAPGGGANAGTFTPGTDAAGVYTYTVAGTAPCANDQATVTVTVIQPPNAGTDGATTLCSTGAPVDLFGLLGGAQAGGTWTFNAAMHSNSFDPASDTPGTYTYTVAGTAPCANDQAIVNVSVNQQPTAGLDGAAVLCVSSPALNLFSELGGSPAAGGTWTFGGAAHGTQFTPGTDTPGLYTYTVTGAAPCTNDLATVDITVTAQPNAGTNGSTSVCASAAAFDLFNLLGNAPDAGGSWTFNGLPHSSTFTPGVDAAGVYTYTITVPPPCTSQSATVTVTVVQPPNAGTDGSSLLCISSPTLNLFSQLGGGAQAGGTWSFNAVPHSNTFTPGTDAAGVYTYTVAGTAPCPNDQSTVTVTVTSNPDPGTNGAITLCASGTPVDLFASLGGTPDAGGSWTFGGAAHSSTFDPAIDLGGVYTYTVSVPPPCTSQSATVTVTVVQPPNAGTDGSALLCISSPALNLLSQLSGGAQAGGTWSFNAAPHSNTFTPGTDAAGVYTYTVAGTAPCPNDQSTVTVAVTTNPDPGTNGVITLCASGTPVDLFASLGGSPDVGGSWSFGGAAHSNTFDPTTDISGVYTYTVTVPPPCTSQSATVTVTVVQPPNAGTDGNTLLCISSPTLDLFTQLGGGAQVGGTWSFNAAPHGNTFTPGTDAAGVYTYTVAGTTPCPNDQSTVTVAVTSNPDPGTNGAITLCASGTPVDLFASLGGTPDAGGSWSFGGAAHSNTFDPATDIGGVYTYTVSVPPPCTNQSAMVTVTVVQPPNAGTDGNTLLCISSPVLNLYSQLGGGAQAGGTWSFNAVPHSNTFTPGTDAAGVYTYTVTGSAPCPNDQSTVTVAVTSNPDPGTNGAITLCASGTPVDLFASLGGTPDAGGSWSFGGAAHSNTFDPTTDIGGVYTYTVTVPPPCTNQSATVTVTVVQPPNAGTDGNTLLCISSPALNLFSQLSGGAQAGGTWSFNAAPHNATFIPGSDIDGVYTYTISGIAPCPSDQSTVTVAVTGEPDPGTNGATVVCATGAAIDLFAQLGGTPDAGGAWSFNGNPHGASFDPAVDAAGVYTYTLTVPPPCSSASSTVTVLVQAPPDAGSDGNLVLCSTSSATNLFAALSGAQAGGTWSFNATPHVATFQPGTDVPGVYTYTVNGTAPCPSDASTVTVTVNLPPNAGGPGAATLCSTGAAVDLFSLLSGSPQVGGTWSTGGATHSNTYDPATDAPGVYTYTVSGTTPCANATADVTIQEVLPPNAGTNNPITLCSSGTAVDLFAQLGGAPASGGTWSGPSAVNAGLFDPTSMAAGAYTYTVSGTAPCPSDAAVVTVTITPAADPGGDGAQLLCIGSAAVDMFTQLTGTPDAGGSWSFSGASHSNVFDPATDVNGVYTYTVPGIAPCPSASAAVTMTVTASPDAGTPGNTTLCASDAAVALLGILGGSPDAGGTWTDPNGAAHGTAFDPATDIAGTYTYTINVPPPCVSTSSTVTIALVQPADPGTDGALTLCTTSAPVDLFSELSGTPETGGQWTFNSNDHPNTVDPSLDAAGQYVYTLTSAAPCPSVSALVDVSINNPPNAGTDGLATLCISSAPVDLFTYLTGSPQAGGTWTFSGNAHTNIFDPATDASGVYIYTVNGTAPCPSASASVTVSVVSTPDPGTNGALTLCVNSAAIDLFAQLGGTPDAGGSWTGPSTVNAGQYDPTSMAAGTYTYTIDVPPPCTSVSSTVTISLQTLPDPGSDGAAVLCATSSATDLFTLLGGTPQAGGTWTDPNGQPHLALFNPATDPAGTYSYTVQGIAPCPAASANVVMTVTSNPDPGNNGAATLCLNDAAIDLFTELGGTPDVGGTWSGPSLVPAGQFDPSTMQQGVYTYTLDVPPPCVSASSTVTVYVLQPPDPGTNGSTVVCISQTPIDLFAQLGGTPDPGGAWAFNGQSHGSYFDPAIDVAGNYTYTVLGNSPCANASATVTVNVVTNPDAGTDGSTTLCGNGSAVDLFSYLGGTPDIGGSWSGPSTVTNGVFDPTNMTAGTYTYTITVPPPCTSVSSAVVITIAAPPDPGTDGTATLCTVSSAIDLFTQLNGTPEAGGAWTLTGAPHNSTFDPAVDAGGDYVYTVLGTDPCPAANALVTVIVQTPPDAGTDGTLNLCISGSPVDMNSALSGADAGGAWTDPNGQPFTTAFDPANSTPGAYTYTVTGNAPCPADAAVITVNVLSDPNAGGNGSMALCTTGPVTDLFAQLTGGPDSGGTWLSPNGQSHSASFDPSQDPAGDYVYIIDVPPPCVNDTATVTMAVVQPPNAGQDGAVTLCPEGTAVDLFTHLTGSPTNTGTWIAPNGSTTDAMLDPATDPAGNYTYTVLGNTPCPNDMATVVVSITDPITGNATTQDAKCNGYCDGTAALQVNGGTPGFTYAWSGSVGGPQDTTATGLCNGAYTVHITDANGCVGTIGFSIAEPPPLIIDAIGTSDEHCPGACDGHITAVDNQGVLFSIDGGTTWQSSGSFQDLCPGAFTVLMQDAHGCQASAPTFIQPADSVIAAFYASPDTTSVSNTTVSFTNQSGNATSFVWHFGGLATTTEGNPVFAFPHVLGGVYDVCLVAVNDYGCADSICHPVVVLDELIVHVPNAFTPNGDDMNEGFVPVFNIPAFVSDYEFLIFDRWGELIFESHQVGEQWTGTMGGDPIKEEVYVWKLTFRDIITHEKHDRIGHVTLLK